MLRDAVTELHQASDVEIVKKVSVEHASFGTRNSDKELCSSLLPL